MKNYDLTIIGAGPVGLFSANFAHLHGLKFAIFDSLNSVGGQPQKLYPFKQILDIPAQASISGAKLTSSLKAGVNKGDLFLGEQVSQIQKVEDHFLVNDKLETKAILLTTGNGSFRPKKFPLKLPSNLVNYFVEQPQDFAGQEIAVFGGGDSALDWALELSKLAQQVTIVHRRNTFRGLESSVSRVQHTNNIQTLTPYLPHDATADKNNLKISLKKVGSGEIIQRSFDSIIVAYGFKADNRLARKWGLESYRQRIKVNTEMATNIPGIYAAGDCVAYNGRVPLIGLGFGEAQIAITSIMKQLFPEKALTIHSTSIN